MTEWYFGIWGDMPTDGMLAVVAGSLSFGRLKPENRLEPEDFTGMSAVTVVLVVE